MRSRCSVRNPEGVYFITSTIVAWLPILTSARCCDILVQSLLYCREHKGLKVYAWVLLENHFHAIVAAPELSATLTDFKRYTARRLLQQIRAENREWLLNQLAFYRAAHKTASEFQVWQEGVHPQEIDSDAMMLQKLDYIQNNPVQRGHVVSPEHWRYSSAHEWLAGGHPCFVCDPWK
jgi:REP element-mobilizing transposase RayT